VRLTVLIPVYNGARHLDASIASVLAQELADFELVIVDDASTDATPAVLAKWAARDPRIVLLRLERNGGISVALNAGLAIARGRYIARQDADDISLPGRFAAQVAALDAHPEAALVSIGRIWIDDEGKTIGTAPYLLQSPAVLRFLLHFTPLAIGVPGQTMMRADAARAVGGWDETFRLAQGWEFATRLAKHGSFMALPQVGMKYRVHRSRVSEKFRPAQLQNATAVTQRMLSELLGRDVTDQEAAASASVWFVQSAEDFSADAARLLREALERSFLLPGGRRSLAPGERRIVRRIFARRFLRTALFHAARMRPRAALRHVVAALRL
jgi:glycosyltransferase involved in cell wall biosynthesis